MSTFFLYVLILFTLLTIEVTRRVSSSSTFSTKTSHIRRTQNDTFVGVFLWSACFLCPTTRRTRNHTPVGVILCSASFLHSITHAEHEMTPSLVSFRARILLYPLE